jgi:porin
MLVMHWGQALFNGKAGVVVGQIAPDDYFNHYRFIHPFFNFYGYGSSITSASNWPNPGFGIGGGVKLTDQWHIKGMLGEAGGFRIGDGAFLHFGDNFFKGHFFKAVEVGWVKSWDERFVDRVALTVMHTDAYEESPDDNWAVGLATNWTFGRWVPFFLAGVGNGKGENTVSKTTATVGLAHTFRSHDVMAGSVNFTHPPGGLRDQYTVETFYPFYLSERLAFTPDIQLVFNPSLNPAKDVMAYFGFRARLHM